MAMTSAPIRKRESPWRTSSTTDQIAKPAISSKYSVAQIGTWRYSPKPDEGYGHSTMVGFHDGGNDGGVSSLGGRGSAYGTVKRRTAGNAAATGTTIAAAPPQSRLPGAAHVEDTPDPTSLVVRDESEPSLPCVTETGRCAAPLGVGSPPAKPSANVSNFPPAFPPDGPRGRRQVGATRSGEDGGNGPARSWTQVIPAHAAPPFMVEWTPLDRRAAAMQRLPHSGR